MIHLKFKQLFFDRKAVISKVDAASRKVLSKFGAFVRRSAKSSIRKRKKPAPPGSPPSSHTGLLKKFIFFGYDLDARSVVIGPTRLNQKGRGEAPPLLEYGGKRVAISTLWRWCREGLRGVHLDYVRIGRRISTSREALNRFFNALAEADESPPPYRYAERKPRPPTARARQRAMEEADRILAEAGICPATRSS